MGDIASVCVVITEVHLRTRTSYAFMPQRWQNGQFGTANRQQNDQCDRYGAM